MREYIDNWMKLIKQLENSGVFECKNKREIKKKIKEIPVVWENDRSSTVSPLHSSIKFFKDLKLIKKNEYRL